MQRVYNRCVLGAQMGRVVLQARIARCGSPPCAWRCGYVPCLGGARHALASRTGGGLSGLCPGSAGPSAPQFPATRTEVIIKYVLHNLVEASFDLFRYLLLGDQLNIRFVSHLLNCQLANWRSVPGPYRGGGKHCRCHHKGKPHT